MNQNVKKLKEIKKHSEDMMNKYGYVVHNVFPSKDDDEILCSHHTHGIRESFNHADLEIVLPLDPKMVAQIFYSMVELIKQGESFEDKLSSDKVIKNFDVQLVKVHDGTRELIRVIIPDMNGKFPGDKDCANVFSNQLDDLNNLNQYV